MHRYRLQLVLLITSILFALKSYAGADPVKVVIYGDAHYPPYSWEQGDQVVGIYLSILRQAFKKMTNYDVELKPVPWKRGLYYLQQGSAFALFPPYYHPTLRPYISPYSVPILDELTVLACYKETFNTPRTIWPDDFFGLVIAVNRGYELGGKAFYRAVAQDKIQRMEIEGTEKNLLVVSTGRTDCYINDINAIKWGVQKLKNDKRFKLQMDNIAYGPTIASQQGFLGYSNIRNEQFPYKSDFVREFDTVIDQMKRSGRIDAIVEQFYRENQPKPTPPSTPDSAP
ncbi:substrate-binding periplasmic protein [Vibrio sp. SCSIO 43137]|uniref:substrate-binding periplasmic protein n=1 Tax=Vibrio sp. SCSIO 43137 TaxID=3021011 RepID=UPI002307165A|nr:transporter substrate-binding domain-containing protein [Vibrio sp. SCSIO 43137]WCE31642.1 transporter substrate-binding domain-containing protein [Vibrio sp. SCSIO 43137]